MSKIEIKDLYLVFGNEKQKALKMLKEGKTKSEILADAKGYKLDDIDDIDTYMKSIPTSYLNDANFIFDFIENIRSNFDVGRDYRIYHLVKYIGDDLKKDKTFVMRMFQQYHFYLLFEFIDPILQKDRDVFKVLLEHDCIEFNILQLLASHPGRVFSTVEIYENVWNEKLYEANNTVMVHMRRLREKVEKNPRSPQLIKTVWGVGYKIEG